MRAISAFAHLMPDSVAYQTASTALDAYGERTYGSAVNYPARVVGERKSITNFQGLEVMSNFTVYLGAVIVAQPDDIIRLSTGLVNSTQDTAIYPPIIGAKREPDQSGTHHAVLYLG